MVIGRNSYKSKETLIFIDMKLVYDIVCTSNSCSSVNQPILNYTYSWHNSGFKQKYTDLSKYKNVENKV